MFEFTHRLRIVSLLFGAAFAVTFASTGCVTHQHHSPGHSVYSVQAPPRSASHGYVHHYRDAVLVFDRSWNGYWVRSHPHHYFHSNHYYRWHSGRWHRARHIRGPWVSIERSAVPAGLHQRGAVKERREDRREAVKEKREDRRQVAKQVKQRREKRREIAESQKTRRVAKASAGAARGSVEHRRTKVRKHEDEDEEHPADRRAH